MTETQGGSDTPSPMVMKVPKTKAQPTNRALKVGVILLDLATFLWGVASFLFIAASLVVMAESELVVVLLAGVALLTCVVLILWCSATVLIAVASLSRHGVRSESNASPPKIMSVFWSAFLLLTIVGMLWGGVILFLSMVGRALSQESALKDVAFTFFGLTGMCVGTAFTLLRQEFFRTKRTLASSTVLLLSLIFLILYTATIFLPTWQGFVIALLLMGAVGMFVVTLLSLRSGEARRGTFLWSGLRLLGVALLFLSVACMVIGVINIGEGELPVGLVGVAASLGVMLVALASFIAPVRLRALPSRAMKGNNDEVMTGTTPSEIFPQVLRKSVDPVTRWMLTILGTAIILLGFGTLLLSVMFVILGGQGVLPGTIALLLGVAAVIAGVFGLFTRERVLNGLLLFTDVVGLLVGLACVFLGVANLLMVIAHPWDEQVFRFFIGLFGAPLFFIGAELPLALLDLVATIGDVAFLFGGMAFLSAGVAVLVIVVRGWRGRGGLGQRKQFAHAGFVQWLRDE